MDKGGQVDTFILDFEKAFDTPPHEFLKCKLFGYGIRGKTLLWIYSFLCSRQQRVVVNGSKSDGTCLVWGTTRHCLGPVVVFVYTNYNFETGSMTNILEQLKWEKRKGSRLIFFYKGLKDQASQWMILKNPFRHTRNHHSKPFQVPYAQN